jgi:arylsulfatase
LRKNLIIGGLVIWNLILTAVLIFVWMGPRRTPAVHATANPGTATTDGGFASGEQNFTYKSGERLVGDKAPPIADRNRLVTATFDTQDKGGVIAAHGGLAQGYALYVEDGQLFFVVRRNNVLTTVDGGKVTAGRHALKMTFSKTGELSVALDGKPPATGQAAGGITAEPMDGLDVGGDRGAPVGLYQVPNEFGGTIESVSLKTTP